MHEEFLINIDRLRKKGNLSLNMAVPSNFLEIEGDELQFGAQVDIQGEAYIVDDRLIFHLDLIIPAIVACTICNGDAHRTVKINNLYHIEEISELKSPIFDFSTVLRQEILLEVPKFAECRDGNCPQRETFKAYLGQKKSS